MRFGVIFYLLGRLTCITGALMVIPAVVSWIEKEHYTARSFLLSAALALFTGLLLLVRNRKFENASIAIRDGFLLVTLTWVFVSFFGAIPFYLSDAFGSFIDAFFESVSGFTTTGASVLSDVETLPRGILLWRSLTQWIGGLGIIVLGVAILPQLSVGGMQLLKNEMPGPTFEQLKPRIKQTALSLWKVYIFLSAILFGLLYLCGMNVFESACHMFSTMSTGGFSPKNASIGAYGPLVQLVVTIFMFLAGVNFVLHYALLHREWRKFLRNTELRFYALVLFLAFACVFVNLTLGIQRDPAAAVITSVFQVVSMATTTGFTTENYVLWPFFSKGILFVLMFVGGCAGSTAGGFKQIRLVLLLSRAKQTLFKQIFPKSVTAVKIERRAVGEDVLDGVGNFFLVYLVIAALGTVVLLGFNFDFKTAVSAIVSMLSNIGPGLGAVGPVEGYGWCPAAVKILLSVCMIVGRLEIFTVLVLLLPVAWKR